MARVLARQEPGGPHPTTAVPNPPRPDEQVTILIVRDGARGSIFQRTWSRRRLTQTAAATGTALAFLLTAGFGGLAGLTGGGDRDRVVAENLELHVRLDQAERTLKEAAPVLRRVRAYDEELRDLARRQALPGFGPLDEEAMAAREAWLDGQSGTGRFDEPTDDMEDPVADADHLLREVAELWLDAQDLSERLPGLGENLDRLTALSDGLPEIWPVDGGVITSDFGYRLNPFGRTEWKFHGGIDIGVPYGTPVYATNDGLVTVASWDRGCGNKLVIDHGSEIATHYCHNSRLLVSVGDSVTTGEMVALVGSTGMSTGPHTHYEIWFGNEREDPLQYLPDR